jgi:ADP-ribosylglycohydrolase
LVEKEKNQQEFMNASTFKEVIRNILDLKGDTDTNAAIVGGLIGAIVGFKNLPYEYLEKQFELRAQVR